MMNTKRFWLKAVMGVVGLLMVGCTSAPELQKYSRSEIDRPYTIPGGVATWSIPTFFGSFSDNSASSFLPPIPVPLFWQTGLSDSWTLNWSPLPLSASHQFSYSRDQVWGTTFGMGFGYGDVQGAVFRPAGALYQRTRIGDNTAWEFVPSLAFQIETRGSALGWNMGLSTGPLFQLSEVFGLRFRAGLYATNGFRIASSVESRVITPAAVTRLTVPLSASFTWSVHRQWDFNGHYGFHGIGYSNGYQAHIGTLTFVHYW